MIKTTKTQIKGIVEKLKKNKDLVAVILYGSYSRNKEYARDVDLCIVLEKNQSKFSMSKKRLSYLSSISSKFDIQIFQLLPLYVRREILKEGKILYCRDIKKIYDIAYKTIKDYKAFEKHYEDYIEIR